MSEDLSIVRGSKQEQYKNLMPQLKALIAGETDQIANMANICGALKEQFDWLWVGFYLVKGEQLVLGPFQGPVACTRIDFNRGVCGVAWAKAETIIVPDVDHFPGHISCSSLSKSEIVVPILHYHHVIAVLDIDSADLNCFDDVDQYFLEKIAELLIEQVEILLR